MVTILKPIGEMEMGLYNLSTQSSTFAIHTCQNLQKSAVFADSFCVCILKY